MTQIRVLAVASEIYPIVKTGGLADVVGALPTALRAYGIETRTLVPGYPDVIKALPEAEKLLHVPHFFGGPVRLLGGSHGNLDLLVLDAPHLFARPGNPYVTSDGKDWPDNGVRFAALSRMAAESVGAPFRRSCPTLCTPMIGRLDCRLPICTLPISPGPPP